MISFFFIISLVVAACSIFFVSQRNQPNISSIVTEYGQNLHVLYEKLANEYFPQCKYKINYTSVLNSSLSFHIKGQEDGIKSIVHAFEDWEFQKASGVFQPLVLAITGSTGIGKSETSYRIGQALFGNTVVGNGKQTPEGLLVLRGEDYAELGSGGILEIHSRIRSQIVEHLRKCSGNAVIVFDEVQKVAPGTLEVLMPALEERGSLLDISSHNNQDTNLLTSFTRFVNFQVFGIAPPETDDLSRISAKYISTSEVVFVFISDIGSDVMTKLLLVYGDRALIPKNVLRTEVKIALDAQWSRLRFGKVIKEIVPFLPLESTHIKDILRAKIATMGRAVQLFKWLHLVVDEEVLDYLVGPNFIKYSVHMPKAKPAPAVSSTDSSGDNAQATAVAAPRPMIFATWGARSLDNAGPFQDLRSMLQRYAQPWRPDELLHIGLTNSSARCEGAHKKWGTSSDSCKPGAVVTQLVYFEWCKCPHAHIAPDDPAACNMDNIQNKVSNGNQDSQNDTQCETVWFGEFPS